MRKAASALLRRVLLTGTTFSFLVTQSSACDDIIPQLDKINAPFVELAFDKRLGANRLAKHQRGGQHISFRAYVAPEVDFAIGYATVFFSNIAHYATGSTNFRVPRTQFIKGDHDWPLKPTEVEYAYLKKSTRILRTGAHQRLVGTEWNLFMFPYEAARDFDSSHYLTMFDQPGCKIFRRQTGFEIDYSVAFMNTDTFPICPSIAAFANYGLNNTELFAKQALKHQNEDTKFIGAKYVPFLSRLYGPVDGQALKPGAKRCDVARDLIAHKPKK